MLINRFAFTLLIIIISAASVLPQIASGNLDNWGRFVFYNVENFFDTNEDSIISYNEFTPDGNRHWTFSRYREKRNHIYKVIAAIGEWQLPAVVAFAEIENRFVLDDLIENTPLKTGNYKVVHYESIDHRGIDVGLIYDTLQMELLYSKPVRYPLVDGSQVATRDILYLKFLLFRDTLHLFINHWPSRYGGMLQSASLRKLAASTMRTVTDSICRAVNQPNILIMGDFNDDPDDESIQFLTSPNDHCQLLNLDLLPSGYPVKGTLKYQSDWNLFDQVIVSQFLFKNNNGLQIRDGKANIFSASFLLEEDEKHLGVKPKRTYIGYIYHEGFSDHLPVYVDIYQNSAQ